MRIGTSLALVAVGLVLAYAVDFEVPGIELRVLGSILFFVGLLGLARLRRPRGPARPPPPGPARPAAGRLAPPPERAPALPTTPSCARRRVRRDPSAGRDA